MEFAQRSFEQSDQLAFAALSGDRNPIHIDPVAARRTQMGAPIVHGIHAVLWAVEAALGVARTNGSVIRAEFLAPIFLGDRVVARLVSVASPYKIELSVDTTTVTRIVLADGSILPARANCIPFFLGEVVVPRGPRLLALADMKACRGALSLDGDVACLRDAYPALCAHLSVRVVQALMGVSTLIGMVCPGLHSLLRGFVLQRDDAVADMPLFYETVAVEERFRAIRMAVQGGGMSGEVTAIARTAPVSQPGFSDIVSVVQGRPFEGTRVLIVGGSRGLGEVAAKLCAAGGADVLLTHALGEADAARVGEEIRLGGGRCETRAFDVRGDIDSQLRNLPFLPSHVYYFASCSRKSRQRHDQMLFHHDAFQEVCLVLQRRAGGRHIRIFYPACHAIAQHDKSLRDYIAAKAEGERLCHTLNRELVGIDILCGALPSIATDQAAAGTRMSTVSAIDALLPIVRDMQAALSGVEG